MTRAIQPVILERTETSLAIAWARLDDSQRFFASLRMTSL